MSLTTISPSSVASHPARIWTSSLGHHTGETVTIKGWLHHRRALKSVCFLIVRDATGLAQVVITDPEVRALAESLAHESVIAVTGSVQAVPQAPGGVELHDPTLTVISKAVQEPVVELYKPELTAQLPTLLDAAAVSLRHPRRAAIQRLTAAALEGFRSTLRAERFTEIATPKIIGTTPEGGANVFELDYFGKPAFLAQSPQLYKQVMVGVLERVFETAPAFRAESHDTARHLNQFISLDAEMGFIEDHFTVMEMTTRAVTGMIAAARALDLESTFPHLSIPDVPATIPHIHFTEALDLISRATGEDVRSEPDLAPAHERWLGDWARQEHGSEWLYVTGYPMTKRPFYTHPDPARPEWSNSFDLLFRGLEIVTGGQRLHRYEDYLASLNARGIDPAGFEGYLLAFRHGMPPHGGFALGLERFIARGIDPAGFEGYLLAFRHGMPPHGGFALGLERFIARITGIANVRETTLFPRDMHRLTP